MDWKKHLMTSTEVWTGSCLTLAGLVALALGLHGVLAQALLPFGIGLALSDVLTKAAKDARQRSKVRVRRDDDCDF